VASSQPAFLKASLLRNLSFTPVGSPAPPLKAKLSLRFGHSRGVEISEPVRRSVCILSVTNVTSYKHGLLRLAIRSPRCFARQDVQLRGSVRPLFAGMITTFIHIPAVLVSGVDSR